MEGFRNLAVELGMRDWVKTFETLIDVLYRRVPTDLDYDIIQGDGIIVRSIILPAIIIRVNLPINDVSIEGIRGILAYNLNNIIHEFLVRIPG